MADSSDRGVHGLPDERQIDDLLDVACVKKNAKTRCDLIIAISYAQSANASEQQAQKRPTTEFLDQLQTSIRKTQMLLQKLEGHADASDIGWEVHSLESEVVKALSYQVLGNRSEPSILPDTTLIGINMQKLLRVWHDRVEKIPRRKRGQPRKQAEDAIVFYAFEFFCRHSTRKPSHDEENPFRAFAERFYETITGACPHNLDWQIRQALESRQRAGD